MIFFTTPGRTCPTWMSERTFLRDSRRDSSIKSRRETTIFFRSKLIFNIRNSYVLPTCSSGLRIGVTSNCEPGKNASTPTSTIKPPLTALELYLRLCFLQCIHLQHIPKPYVVQRVFYLLRLHHRHLLIAQDIHLPHDLLDHHLNL